MSDHAWIALPSGSDYSVVTDMQAVQVGSVLIPLTTRLTDEERDAVEWASATLCVGWHDLDADGKTRSRNAAAALRGLLERTRGGTLPGREAVQ